MPNSSGGPSSGSSPWSVEPARVAWALGEAARGLGDGVVWLHEVARLYGSGAKGNVWRERARHLAVIERALRDVQADYLPDQGIPLPRADS